MGEEKALGAHRCCRSSGFPVLNILLSNEVECSAGTWFTLLKITWDLQLTNAIAPVVTGCPASYSHPHNNEG